MEPKKHHSSESAGAESQKLGDFWDTMQDGIVVTDLRGLILHGNRALMEHLGYSPEELNETHVLDLHPAAVRGEAERVFTAMLRGERTSCPLPVQHKNGAVLPVETRIHMGIWNHQPCIIGSIRPMTERMEEEQRFERLFEQNPTPIALTILPNRTFHQVNQAFLDTFGYRREEVIGKRAADLGIFEDPASHDELAERLQRTGRVEQVELVARGKDGRRISGLYSGEVLHHQGKDFFLTVMLDITARIDLEKDLRRRIAFEELLVATSSALFQAHEEELDALITHILQVFGEFIDVDRVYLFLIDPARTHMSNTHEWAAPGINPEKDNLQGIPLAAFPQWMDSLARRKLVHIPEVAALPDSWSVEREILGAQGIQSLLALPVFSDGQLLGFSGFDAVRAHREWTSDEQNLLQIMSDNIGVAIHRFAQAQELRDASKRAVDLAQEAKQANEAKSTFLANMSHEIRTPMNAILGFAQILNRDLSMSPEHQSNLQTIIQSGEHLLALLNDILDMSKIESGQTRCQQKPFALTELLGDVLDSLLPLAERKGLCLRLETIPPLPQTVIGDQGKLRQVLINLVGNAVKFTTRGEVLLRTTASPVKDPNRRELRIEVCDTGPGIPADEIPKIFLPFQQATTGVPTGGTGLGLPISRSFMEEMGGTLDVRSQVGHGSCFTCLLTIPFDTSPPSTARDNHEPLSGIVTPHGAPKILVVDDVETNRTMVRLLLGPVGFEVFEAENGAEAVRSIERVRPDAVLMDMRMPVMDGYEATAAIRKLPLGRTLPIIAVTASAFDGDEEGIRAIGVDGYIRKPFSPEELFDTLGHLLSLRYRRRPPARPETTSSPEGKAPPRQEDAPLSAVLVAKMLAAIEDGDMETLTDLLNQAEDAAPVTTARLRSLSEQYDYDRLQATLVREKRTHE